MIERSDVGEWYSFCEHLYFEHFSIDLIFEELKVDLAAIGVANGGRILK